jgi:hypothetical protein
MYRVCLKRTQESRATIAATKRSGRRMRRSRHAGHNRRRKTGPAQRRMSFAYSYQGPSVRVLGGAVRISRA